VRRRSHDIIAEVLRRPVAIVQRNKPRLLLSIEGYRLLLARQHAGVRDGRRHAGCTVRGISRRDRRR
jgi:hypothetical protein